MTDKHVEIIARVQQETLVRIRDLMQVLVRLHVLDPNSPDANNLAFHLPDYAERLRERMTNDKFPA